MAQEPIDVVSPVKSPTLRSVAVRMLQALHSLEYCWRRLPAGPEIPVTRDPRHNLLTLTLRDKPLGQLTPPHSLAGSQPVTDNNLHPILPHPRTPPGPPSQAPLPCHPALLAFHSHLTPWHWSRHRLALKMPCPLALPPAPTPPCYRYYSECRRLGVTHQALAWHSYNMPAELDKESVDTLRSLMANQGLPADMPLLNTEVGLDMDLGGFRGWAAMCVWRREGKGTQLCTVHPIAVGRPAFGELRLGNGVKP